jgi:hypothetical protein
MSTIKKDKILKRLRAVFWRAVRDNKWYAASQVAALQDKCLGIFDKRRFPDVKRISEMSQRELHDFVAVLEKYEPELKNMNEWPEEGFPKKKPFIPDPNHPPPLCLPGVSLL